MNTISRTAEKLRDPEYRKAFVASQINFGIPFQVRALLKRRGQTQEWLAAKTGMLQPRISGLMTPGKTRPNTETLRRLAEAFDCGLVVRFVPFSELARWSASFDPAAFDVPEFEKDLGFIERKMPEVATTSTPVVAGTLVETGRYPYRCGAVPTAKGQLGVLPVPQQATQAYGTIAYGGLA